MVELRKVGYLAGGCALGLTIAMAGGCATESPTDPGGVAGASRQAPGAVAHSPNNAPVLVLRTRPAYNEADTPPSIFGTAPLTVNFNLCESRDPDQDGTSSGDSINWLFHWGDDGTSFLKPDGSFNANFSGFCRQEHEYREGSFTATLAVTDKHLEDQGGDVTAAALTRMQVTINSVNPPVGNTSNSVETIRTPS